MILRFFILIMSIMCVKAVCSEEYDTNESGTVDSSLPQTGRKYMLHASYSPTDNKTYAYEIDKEEFDLIRCLRPYDPISTNLPAIINASVNKAIECFQEVKGGDASSNNVIVEVASIEYLKNYIGGEEVWICCVYVNFFETRDGVSVNARAPLFTTTIISLLNGQVITPIYNDNMKIIDAERIKVMSQRGRGWYLMSGFILGIGIAFVYSSLKGLRR